MAHNTIDQLNHLVNVNRDAEEGFRAASTNVKNSELATLFEDYARQHAKFSEEIQAEIKRLGGTPAGGGTFGGALHRGWMDLKSSLSGRSARAMLKSCETGEESAEIAYLDASDGNPTGQTHAVIAKHKEQIGEFRKHLARLVSEIKDGSDFPENI